MAAPDLTAGQVMNISASLLNDSARSVYTYAAQLPYLQMALHELREAYELNDIQTTQDVSSVIELDAGITSVGYNGVPPLSLPDDMVEPAQLWERVRGIDPYVPMTRRDYLPLSLAGIQTGQFVFYVWQDNEIRVMAANRNNDIKIDYVRELFQSVVDENSSLNVINAATFLQYRTAALCAEFIERNLTSA